ncbi:MAG: hypothetical protein HDR22_06340 [Lachnospiraceae bacterium]|nr:hypothetical protein [Lachnospiraceae bacterium]
MDENRVQDEFTHGQIKVKCPYPIQTVCELEITRKLNEHGRVFVKGILREEEGARCIHRVGSQDPIAVYGVNGPEETLLFSGVVTELDVCYQDCTYYVEMKGLSWSSLLDYEEKSRSFQDKGMSYAALLQQVMKDYPGSMFVNKTKPSGQSIGQFILQYRETDWEFCKRLATHFQTQLVADIFGGAPGFWFGLPKNNKTLKSVSGVVTKRDAGQYHKAAASDFWLLEEQFVKYDIESKERLELGDLVEYEGRSRIIEESRFFLEKGVLHYTYVLGLEESLRVPKETNARIHGISLLGKVLERENQQVKLELDIDKGQDVDTACWFPYASQANNLFYCMPEIGTTVSLYFSSSDETSGIAMNAVRKNGGSCAKTSNPKLKYMGIPEGKEFKLGVTDIDFVAHEKLFMKMTAESGVLVQSHEDFNVFTKQKLFLEAKELIKVFARTGNILVGAKEESALYLLGGADGDTHIKAGNNLIYEGRRKEIFTERLNEEIAYEEKKFEWGKLLKNVLIGLAVVAVVAVAAAAVAATGGAALAAVGVIAEFSAASTAASVAMAAGISGAIAVGMTAASDMIRGEVSDWQDYALAGLKGAIEGAVSGAILGIKALEGAKLIVKMLVSGGVSFLTDAISQGIDILTGRASGYNWKQGLLSFGIGFIMPAASAVIRKASRKILEKFGKSMPKWLEKAFCKLGGDPVDLISGNVIYDTIDFELPGPLPLQWRRIWCSASQIVGHLGHGTRYNYEIGLEVLEEEYAVAVFLNDGRVCIFPDILIGEEAFSEENRLLLRRKEDHYQLFDPESRYSYLLYPSENGYLSYKLTRMQNSQGHQIQFSYDRNGYLCQIIDSVGRKLDVITNQQGCITQIALKDEDNERKSYVLVCYDYNREHDLETITDAVGADTCLTYRNHLLVRKTDRNKHSFYWEYDCYEDGARALRTWGDEGVLSLWIDYHDEERYNTVRTGQKSLPSEYHYNEKMLCTRIVYPDLTETRETYNDRYQLVSRVDEEGRFTLYQYNDWSQITSLTRADASKILFNYDEAGRLVEAVNPEGGSRKWIYKEDDTLDKIVDEAGMETTYEYNRHKLVEKVAYAGKEEIHLEYDRHLNLSKVTLPDGSSSSWEYDQRGNCLNARNPLGGVETYQYDNLNRLVKAGLADGNEIQLTYNGYENVIHAKDKQTEVDFTYTVLGSLASRTQDGRKIAYEYNSQEELISVTNEKGEVYQFERDVKGNIVKEVGYDNLTRTYERDYSGLVTKINRPGGRFTKYSYDKLGQLIRADYHDKSYETFTYNKLGALLETENQYTKVKLERDQLGRVIKEWQDQYWILSKYDEQGSRIQTTSSFGANILTRRNELGQATHLAAYLNSEKPWAAKMEYNALGQETQRLLSGGICSSWEYDTVGRPVFHEVSIQQAGDSKRQGTFKGVTGYSETRRRRRYEWDVNYRLKKVTNELTKGTAVFSYDQFSNLVCAKESGFETIFRTTDCVGNLYETQDNSDRIYGAGSRLEKSGIDLKEKRNSFQGGYGRLVTKGNEYFYDEEGNLAKKVEPNGDTWSYLYFGNGMLRKVIRPDKSGVSFKYDPLGRRIEKAVTKAGSEEVSELEGRIPSIEEGTWETVGGVRIRKPNTEMKKPHVVKGVNQSIYEEESCKPKEAQENAENIEKVIRFLWDGNTLLHEWGEENPANRMKPKSKVDYKADYLLKLEKQEEEKAGEEAERGQRPPDSLVTWIFQDDFIPRGKITKDGNYSIISDYLGTPVEAYDEEGKKVWERELDIYGRVKKGRKDAYGRTEKETGEKNFIPFRFQGQYEDEETGLYYNRFRYYSPEDGCYTQQDPIGLAGNNPTIYGYVDNPSNEIDLLGLSLSWSDFLIALGIPKPTGLTRPHGHHIVFKGNFSNKIAIPVSASKEILEHFKIDINDPANLMWASNIEGVHTEINAQKVLARLKAMETKLNQKLEQNKITFKQAQAEMKEELQRTGKDVFLCY